MRFIDDMKKQGKQIGSIAIVNENTDYGTSVADAIEAAAKEKKLPVAIRIPYSASTTDVSAQVLQLKEKQPDVVIFISYTADSILYIKTMKNLDYLPPMVLGDDSGFSDPSFVPAITDIGQGLMNRSAWDIGKPGTTTYKINEMYKAKTGRDLDDTSGRNMQACFAMAEAINRAGSTDPAKMQAALKATDLKPEQLMMGYRGVKYDETGTEHPRLDLPDPAQGQGLCAGLARPGRRRQARLADEGVEVNSSPDLRRATWTVDELGNVLAAGSTSPQRGEVASAASG